ncbi:MAG TPA: GrpB family protein [Roseiflexaceae bacterium]|nr:GrpB family protein [Roseiflexaceae bacterium]
MPGSDRNDLPAPMTDEQIQAAHINEVPQHNAPIHLAEYDPEWPRLFEREAARIRGALGERVLLLEHAGSTSVPGLIAKPRIDMALVVENTADEASYVPALEAAGYMLKIREPDWYEHRLFKGPDTDINLHVFSNGCEEVARMLRFRDWLRGNDADRALYEHTKRELAQQEWKYVQNYADAKSAVVREILARASRIKLDLHYVNPRLVELYDLDNPRGADTDFYVDLATEVGARTIVDLGCGTGLLTREFATGDRQVIGVDPSPAMLAVAQRHPGAARVRWIEGDSSAIGTPDADLLVMTGNVAQVFLEDAEWAATLHAIHAALKPGGYLAFESRNPDDRAWERWNRAATFERIDSPYGPMECWLELIEVGDGRVRFAGHNIFLATGETLIASSELRFRSLAELTDSLYNAGFAVEHVYGDWQRGPFVRSSRTMIFVARRR